MSRLDLRLRNSKTPVSRISEHFRFALEESFERPSRLDVRHPKAEVMASSLPSFWRTTSWPASKNMRYHEFKVHFQVAPDFLWLFRATAWLLQVRFASFCA